MSLQSVGVMEPGAITGSFVWDQLPQVPELPAEATESDTSTVSTSAVSGERTTLMNAMTREAFLEINQKLIDKHAAVNKILMNLINRVSSEPVEGLKTNAIDVKKELIKAGVLNLGLRQLIGVSSRVADATTVEAYRKAQIEKTLAQHDYADQDPTAQDEIDQLISALVQSPAPDELKLKTDQFKFLVGRLNEFNQDLNRLFTQLQQNEVTILQIVELPSSTDAQKILKDKKILYIVSPLMLAMIESKTEMAIQAKEFISLVPSTYLRLVELFNRYEKIHKTASKEELEQRLVFAASLSNKTLEEVRLTHSKMYSDYLDLKSTKQTFERAWAELVGMWRVTTDIVRACGWMSAEKSDLSYGQRYLVRPFAVKDYVVESIKFPKLQTVRSEDASTAAASNDSKETKGWFDWFWWSSGAAPAEKPAAVPSSSSDPAVISAVPVVTAPTDVVPVEPAQQENVDAVSPSPSTSSGTTKSKANTQQPVHQKNGRKKVPKQFRNKAYRKHR